MDGRRAFAGNLYACAVSGRGSDKRRSRSVLEAPHLWFRLIFHIQQISFPGSRYATSSCYGSLPSCQIDRWIAPQNIGQGE